MGDVFTAINASVSQYRTAEWHHNSSLCILLPKLSAGPGKRHRWLVGRTVYNIGYIKVRQRQEAVLRVPFSVIKICGRASGWYPHKRTKTGSGTRITLCRQQVVILPQSLLAVPSLMKISLLSSSPMTSVVGNNGLYVWEQPCSGYINFEGFFRPFGQQPFVIASTTTGVVAAGNIANVHFNQFFGMGFG